MPATVIAERIGWESPITVFKDRICVLRPQLKPVNPASRSTYQADELAHTPKSSV
ncbi:hypothetical protein J2853_002683 [Streptosporangium lutulentum]|uniref:Uncharacterized protein n=1 Tax=Streptosporangium lutulentum TaxID=1461250 RepID=A0ABT9QA02_9ACTN|nr:hypothetical protein [Streptosporangium lutulentum]